MLKMNYVFVIIIIFGIKYNWKVAGQVIDDTVLDEESFPYPDVAEVDDNGLGEDLTRIDDKPVKAWPNAEIYYEVIQSDFNKDQLNLITEAMCLIEKASCVRFIPKTPGTKYYLSVQSASICSTNVGRQHKNPQIVHLNKKVCFTRVGQISHEFFHALGFIHELQRTDRDNYVIMHFDNLIDPSHTEPFEMKDKMAANYEGPFDFESIMLYNQQEFAKKGKNSFDPKPGVKVPKGIHIGQRSKLSAGDIKKINSFYKCSKITPKATTCTES